MKQLLIGLSITAIILTFLWKLIPVDEAHATLETAQATSLHGSSVDVQQLKPSVHFAQGPFAGKTLGIRVSGLVCDLCVGDIEKAIKSTDNVVDAVAFPRNGVVIVSLSGEPNQSIIQTILQHEGYKVHGFALSQESIQLASENPKKYADNLWVGGAYEQEVIMSTKEGQQSTCEKKASFGHYQQTAWAQPVLQSTPVKQ